MTKLYAVFKKSTLNIKPYRIKVNGWRKIDHANADQISTHSYIRQNRLQSKETY